MGASAFMETDIHALLQRSQATSEFAEAVRAVAKLKRPHPLVEFRDGVPAVKILRVIAQLLETEPTLEIRRVSIEGVSGCSNFTGRLFVNGGERTYDFDWDCRWRAEKEGWHDVFGYPDQARAAREFGYRCFRRFVQISSGEAPFGSESLSS